MDINYYKQYEPIFGVWHITRLIGEGSFGKVFEMEREDFGQVYKAALKAITIPASQNEVRSVRSEGMDEESVRATFHSKVQELVKEFALMSKLKGNSNVVSYENHQVIEHKDNIGWDILIQMELLTPLDEYIQKKKALPRQEIIKLGIDLCKALELCQKHNIIHRDIKPENTFISENGDFKLGDFGVARTIEKTTGGLSKQGSYPYMAPEIYNGKPYGSTVDIYSLGLILYRLLNGNRLPFLPAAPAPITYADRENAMAKRFNGAPLPIPSHADGRLGEIVLKACAFEPKDRYSSPGQMRQELEAILYNKEEGQYIYPDGDEVPQDSIHSSKGDDEPPIRQEEGTVSDFGGTASDFGKTVSDFGGSVSDFGSGPNAGGTRSGGTKSTSLEGWNGTPAAPVRKKGGKRWIGVGAACLLAVFLAVGLLSQGGGEKKNVESPQGDSQGDTAPVADYLEKVTDEEGRVIRMPLFRNDSVSYLEYCYDEQGNRIQSCTYDLLGNLEERTEWEYNSDGIRLVSRTYDGAGALTSYYENTLDENGQISRSDDYDGNGMGTGYRLYTYDSQGRQSRVEYYTAAGDLDYAYIYEHDAQGRNNKTSVLTEEGELSQYTVWERDAQGNLTESTTYNAEDRLLVHTTYDSFERAMEQQWYDDQGALDETRESLYDEGGFLSRFNTYDGDGVLETYETYTYGQNGKQTAASRYTADGVLKQETQYDSAGNHVKSSSYDENGTLSWVDEYEDSNLVKSSWYNEDGTVNNYTVYEYDSAGNRVKSSSYDENGTLSWVDEYEDSNLVKSSWYNEDGTVNNYTVYEYDSAGNRVKTSQYNENGILDGYTISEYDSDGNCVKESSYSGGGTLSQFKVFEYNEQGQETKCSYYDKQGTLQWYSVTNYDADGSFVGSTRYDSDGSPL